MEILGTKLEALRPKLVTPGTILTLRPLDAKLGTWEGKSELLGARGGYSSEKP